MDNDYYTYAYLREDKTPYYIGKGRGKRVYCKNRTINAPTDKSRIIFLKKNLTEAEAFKHEVYMIAIFGRKDLGTGILRNLTNGGEGTSGAVVSAETRKKMSERKSGEKHPMYGRTGEKHPRFGVPLTEETKKKMSEARSGRFTGENNPMYGRTGEKHPLFGVPNSEEQKKAKSEKMTGENNPMYGRTGEKNSNYGNTGALNPSRKAMISIEPDGTQRYYGGIAEAARELGINLSTLRYFLKNSHVPTRGKSKGWQFLLENR